MDQVRTGVLNGAQKSTTLCMCQMLNARVPQELLDKILVASIQEVVEPGRAVPIAHANVEGREATVFWIYGTRWPCICTGGAECFKGIAASPVVGRVIRTSDADDYSRSCIAILNDN